MTDSTDLAANKQLVTDMWHQVIDARDPEAARKYIAADYIQHSPSAEQGLEACIAFLHVEFARIPPGKLTQFEHVIAEGDVVQLVFKRNIPNPYKPGEMVDVWWYDTYRVSGGMIVEHWDCAYD